MTVLPEDDYDDWREHAACRNTRHPDVWYPDKEQIHTIRAAKIVCKQCPVRADCLDAAFDNGEPFGIWGGYTPQEREVIRRNNGIPKRKPPELWPHGTEAGYKRHRRRGEPPCALCVRGSNAAKAKRRDYDKD